MSFDGQQVIITGAGSGIGRALALAFAAEGARVLGVGRRREALDQTRSLLGGRDHRMVAADISEPQGVEAVYVALDQGQAPLRVLVNNAGVFHRGPLGELDLAEWDRLFAVNLRGAFLMTRAAVGRMARGACIINISSTLGLRPIAGCAAYSATKAGLNALTQALALELAPQGIRALAICPGVVDTPIHDGARAALGAGPHDPHDPIDLFEQAAAKLHPLGRLGKPQEIAQAAVFLASDASAWTTGSLLPIDGGINL